jgi:hypothetical protein
MSSAHGITFECSRPSLLPESPCGGADPPRCLPGVLPCLVIVWSIVKSCLAVEGFKAKMFGVVCLCPLSRLFGLAEAKFWKGSRKEEATLTLTTSGQMGFVDATSAVICLQFAGTNRDPAMERLEVGIRRRKPSSFPNLERRRRDAQASLIGSCCCLGCCLDWGSHKCRNCGKLRGFQLRGLCLSACI